MKSNIARIFVPLLWLICSLFAAFQAKAQQEIVKLGEYGEVLVTYMLVSEKMGEAKAIQIHKMGGVVDMAAYPDGKLAIKVEVLDLKRKHTLYLSPHSFPSTLHGFTKAGSPKPSWNKGEKVTVKYNYAPDRLDESKAVMRATFYVQDREGNPVGKSDGYHARGQRYTLRPAGAGNTEAQASQGSEAADDDAPPPSGRSAVDAEAEAWRRASETNTIAAYEAFLNTYHSGQYAERARVKLAALRPPAHAPSGYKPPVKSPSSGKAKDDIAQTLTIRESRREDLGNTVEVTLSITGYGETFPSISVDPADVPLRIEGSQVKLTIPKEKGEVRVRAEVPGVNFLGGNNIHTIDVRYQPLHASISIKRSGSIIVDIKEGKPPYELRFLDGESVSKILTVGDKPVQQTLEKEEIDALQLISGSYRLQIVDALGNATGQSDKLYTVGGDWFSVWKQAVLPAVMIIIFLVGYFFYRSRKKKAVISPEEREKYDWHLAQKAQTESANTKEVSQQAVTLTDDRALAAKASAAATDDIRRKITITKREKEAAQAPFLPAKKTRSRPQLKRVRADEGVELLMGQASEYKRVDMLDVWPDSIVSDLYIREVVAYRINQFVFEENKAMLEGRGEKTPEIGGWLMGRQRYDERQGKYLVSFERFIQVHRPQGHTTTQLEFGAYAWQALEKAKDIYKDEGLETVGWFHTHPGWGVFLSGEDINTHETIFTEPYSIAMELESVQAPYDVGFFSRRKEKGQLALNNRAEAYHTWEDFRDWLKNG